jgi:hypothetical protein
MNVAGFILSGGKCGKGFLSALTNNSPHLPAIKTSLCHLTAAACVPQYFTPLERVDAAAEFAVKLVTALPPKSK